MATPKRALRRASECHVDILKLNPIELNSMIITLLSERFMRKSNDIMHIFQLVNNSWNETFYVMFLRMLGGAENNGAMTELGRRVTNYMLLREKHSIVSLEAMLLGGAGLLSEYPVDDYTQRLRDEFTHLSLKYNIAPMTAQEWQLNTLYPHNHPTLRLAQVASCIHRSNLTMSRALECRTADDVYELFSGKASDYWIEHFIVGGHYRITSRRIGHNKSDMLGINLVAAIMYAYGGYTHSDGATGNLYELLENISAESNRYTIPWYSAGVEPTNAAQSQAFIQLSKEYCTHSRCEECPLFQRLSR